VQEKQPVIFNGGSCALPDRTNPSTHILKFETVPRVCLAESMANDMARRLGFPVANIEFLRSGTGRDAVPYLRIQRYDRERGEDGRLRRLHQEDLLQALGEPTSIKYQREGGPSIGQVAEVLKDHSARPVEALGLLRDWQMFNYLIGNWDGHGKNLALLYSLGEAVPALAPFYDLVAVEFLNLVRPNSWSRDMAFCIGKHYVPEQITKADWEQFAGDLGMPVKPLFSRLEELTGRMPEIAREAGEAFGKAHGDEGVSEQLEESIRRRCHWTQNTVFARIPHRVP
jgi:serine/threonine-protein kinase HipA